MTRITPFLLIATFMSIALNSFAQDQTDTTRFATGVAISGKPFYAKVRLINNRKLKGELKSIGPYSITLENIVYKESRIDYASDSSVRPGNEIRYSDIMDIKIKGTTGEVMGGFLIGSLVGAVGGALAGIAIPCTECDSDEKFTEVFAFAGIGAVILGPVGAIESPYIVHVTIDGEYGNYEEFKYRMEKKMAKRRRKQGE